MIHYHGTPIGGSRDEVGRFLPGRNALIPMASQSDLELVLDSCQTFVLDNSAYSYWKGKALENDIAIDSWFNQYQKWCEGLYRHPAFNWALIPDVIDGTEEKNAELIMRWVRSGTKVKGCPVWHLHESFEWLEWLVDNCEWVALGSSGRWPNPGASSWITRMEDVMQVMCDSEGRPKCKIHGLRMLATDIFTHYPFAAADSTNAAVNSGSLSRFGTYIPASRSQRAAVIADRIEMYSSPSAYQFHPQEVLL